MGFPTPVTGEALMNAEHSQDSDMQNDVQNTVTREMVLVLSSLAIWLGP